MKSDLIRGNAVIGQSGGPTAVINQSLAGVILALREKLVETGTVKTIYGMRHGVNGLVSGDVIDLTTYAKKKLEIIAQTPSAALGSSRDKPDADYCLKILASCKKLQARYFFYIGGNDSSDTCRIVNDLAVKNHYDLRCFHVPKTVDNDLVGSDHTPGYPSAARFLALAFMSDSMDNASLPGVKINVVMGRHAGFLTAASALARGTGKDAGRNGPHLIYVPEVNFDPKKFLKQVEAVYSKLGRCQIAVSEGVQDSAGRPIATTLATNLDKDMHGNVQLSGVSVLGDSLADLVKKNLKVAGGKSVRVRADTFGYLQRCWPDPSPVDSKEARQAGKFAVKCAAKGLRSGSVAITREEGKKYKSALQLLKLEDVAAKTRHMPREFIDANSQVTKAFLDYVTPLVGSLPIMARL